MTREELRRTFRQAQQEEFFMVPEQPTIHASPQFQRKMARMLGLAPRPVSKKKRIAIFFLVAVLLILGGCTIYQVVTTQAASIKYTGKYQYGDRAPEYHYLVEGYGGGGSSRNLPHYQIPDPEGFIRLCENVQSPTYLYAQLDQWYNPQTGAVLNLTQELMYTGLRFEPPIQLESTILENQNGEQIEVYSGCTQQRAYAFWLYGNSAMKVEYWGNVSQQQLLDWIGQMDYGSHAKAVDLNTVSDFYCYLDYDPWEAEGTGNSDSPEWVYRYALRDEVYDQMEESATGRDEEINYNFAAAPEGFTLIKAENEEPVTPPKNGFHSNGATYTYQNQEGVTLVLSQLVMMPLPNNSGCFLPGFTCSQPMEEVKVLDMDGLYGKVEDYNYLVWRYGGRWMEILYYGDISQQEMIALAETVDYSQN